MQGRREPLLFAGVAALVGALSWLQLGDAYEPRSTPAGKRVSAAAVDLPAAIRLGPLADAPPGQREESVFAPPRELLPLDPLVLPDPPLPPLSVRRPAVQPALQGERARAYRMPAGALGRLVLGDASAEAADGGASEGASEGAVDGAVDGAAAGPAARAAVPGDKAAPGPDEATLEQRHDWVARTQNRPRLYGTILNADPIALAERPGEDLRFQQVSERTGGPLGAPFMIPRGEVLQFGLARTFDNLYLQRSHQLGSGPGAAAGRRALALEMLAAADAEPRALDYALAEVRVALAGSPGDPATSRLLAAVQRARFDVEGELAVYREALAAGTADPALVAGYARLARRLSLPERAAELVVLGRTLGRQTAELPVADGLLRGDAGDWPGALAAFREAETLPFVGPLEPAQKRELLLLTGEAQLALGQLDDAGRQAGRVLLDDPHDVAALRLRGAVLDAQDDLPGAAGAFGEALAADPGSAATLTDAAIVAWRQGDGDGSRRLLSLAIQADPLQAVAPTLALGFLYEDAGQLEAARDTYAQALELEPANAEALYRLGRNQRQDGDPEAAMASLRRALAVAGPEVLVLLELSRAAMDRGRHDEALRYAREAERLEPDNGEVQWYLGLAALFAGDTLSCRRPLEQAAAAGQPGAHAALAVASYRRGDAAAALVHLDEVAKAFAGRGGDPQALYAAAQAAAIRDNLGKRQWLDRFGRSALQRGWTEHMWDGSPRVLLAAGGVAIEGRVEKTREDDRPGIGRAVDGRGFFGVAAEVSPGAGGETRTGLSLSYSQNKGVQGRLPKARLEIFVDADGVVRVSALDYFDTVLLDGQPLEGLHVSPGDAVTVGIDRLDEVAGRFAFTVAGRRVGPEVECKSLRDFKSAFDLLVWAEAAPGRPTAATIGLVRIVQAP